MKQGNGTDGLSLRAHPTPAHGPWQASVMFTHRLGMLDAGLHMSLSWARIAAASKPSNTHQFDKFSLLPLNNENLNVLKLWVGQHSCARSPTLSALADDIFDWTLMMSFGWNASRSSKVSVKTVHMFTCISCFWTKVSRNQHAPNASLSRALLLDTLHHCSLQDLCTSSTEHWWCSSSALQCF